VLDEQLRRCEELRRQAAASARELADLQARLTTLDAERASVERRELESKKGEQTRKASLEELGARSKQLREQIAALKKLPAPKELRYRTPVSQPLQTEEVMFECLHGRVTFIDLGALNALIKRDLRSKADLLRDRWEVSDVTEPVGPFRLRYVVERERSAADSALPGATPPLDRSQFRCAVVETRVEPLTAARGETADAALASGSAFRKVIDAIDPHQTAVTMWVYPDSFALYRRLRDHLHQRDMVVAGRPLPEGVPIGSGKNGTASRGQ
jgi:hypothetical protein